MRRTIALTCLLALAACGNPDTPGGRAADARHESFEEMGVSMKALDDQLKADAPDVAAIRKAAGEIAAAAPKLESWFPQGSSKADGMRTHALQAVWDKPEEFKQAATRFLEEANAFNALAQSGDVAALKQGMAKLGGSCKGCHDKFKEAD